MENTRITYLYTDASNYHKPNVAVVTGRLLPSEILTIIDCCDGQEFFIPGQVGLPERRFGPLTEDDHCWFKIGEEDFEPTDAAPTVSITARELLESFKAAKDNWKDDIYPNEESNDASASVEDDEAPATEEKRFRFCIPVGDYHQDGHHMVETFIASAEKDIAAVQEAYSKCDEKLGIAPWELCNSYNDARISPEQELKLRALGFNLDGLYRDEETGQLYAQEEQFACDKPEFAAELCVFLLNLVDPDLHVALEPEPEEIPCLLEANGRRFGNIGYGLFSF